MSSAIQATRTGNGAGVQGSRRGVPVAAAGQPGPLAIAPETWDKLRAALAKTVTDKDFQERTATWDSCLGGYGIGTVRRAAAFLGQCSAESSFVELAENMNYTAKRIVQVWPSRFKTVEDAMPYEHNPEKLGNKVYSDRLGNGDEDSGDGYRFRGHGDIQTTGRDAFTRFGKVTGRTPEQAVAYASTPAGAIEVSCWEWQSSLVTRRGRHCNDFADAWDMKSLTLLINGGLLGLQRRIDLCTAAFRILAEASGVPRSDYPADITPAP